MVSHVFPDPQTWMGGPRLRSPGASFSCPQVWCPTSPRVSAGIIPGPGVAESGSGGGNSQKQP